MRHSPLGSARREVAVGLLSEALGEAVSVVSVEPIGHEWAPVHRVLLNKSVGGVGAAVVKTIRTDGGSHGGPPFLRREIAAHLLLGSSGGPAVVAELLGYDVDAGVMVVEHVSGVTLEERLLGDTPGDATEALCAQASALGQLHHQSVGREDEYSELLLELGAEPGDLTWRGANPDDDTLSQIETLADALGFAPPPPAADEYLTLLRVLENEHQVLAHVDSNPGNVIHAPSKGASLVDLESSAWTHAAADVACFVMPFPFWSAHLSMLPTAVRREAVSAYATAMPGGWDLDAVIAVALASPVIRRLARLASIADETASPPTRWRRRAQMIQQLDVAASVGSALSPPLGSAFPALAAWLAHFRSVLAARWPEALEPQIEPFPAYGGIRRRTA